MWRVNNSLFFLHFKKPKMEYVLEAFQLDCLVYWSKAISSSSQRGRIKLNHTHIYQPLYFPFIKYVKQGISSHFFAFKILQWVFTHVFSMRPEINLSSLSLNTYGMCVCECVRANARADVCMSVCFLRFLVLLFACKQVHPSSYFIIASRTRNGYKKHRFAIIISNTGTDFFSLILPQKVLTLEQTDTHTHDSGQT